MAVGILSSKTLPIELQLKIEYLLTIMSNANLSRCSATPNSPFFDEDVRCGAVGLGMLATAEVVSLPCHQSDQRVAVRTLGRTALSDSEDCYESRLILYLDAFTSELGRVSTVCLMVVRAFSAAAEGTDKSVPLCFWNIDQLSCLPSQELRVVLSLLHQRHWH